MKIKVIRGKGNIEKQEPITSILISSIPVAKQRGRVEIDIGEQSPHVVQQTTYSDASVSDIVKSYDRLNGKAWLGVITSVQHGMDKSGNLITEQNLLKYEPS
ncbi:MAG TPA: hypothetical protein EYP59_09205 [Thiotrichaceae bacterium]|nr:hypothetical protein [Thiotrichaceae bacterium]